MRLNNNIYLVIGSSGRGCLYDLRDEFAKVYSLNEEAVELIQKTISSLSEVPESLSVLSKQHIIVDTPDIEEKHVSPSIDFAWIEITKACPYKCIHCYNESDKISSTCFMSFDDFKLACQRIKEKQIDRIQLIGGEPLFHPDYKRMIQYAADLFSDIEVYTNGFRIDEDLIPFYKQHNIKFALSYHSDIEAEYEKVTQVKGSFQRLQKTIDVLKKNGITYRLQAVHIKGITYSEHLKEMLGSSPDMPRLVGTAKSDLYDDKMLEQKRITQDSVSTKKKSEEILKNMVGHNCFSTKIYIDYKLNVYPCVMERELCHGNIKANTIHDVLNPQIIGLTKDKIDGCKDCEYRYFCFDCRPDRGTNNYLCKPWYCSYDEQNGVWL